MTMYFCRDCKHSKMDFIDKVFTLGGRFNLSDISYKCSKFPKKETVVENMVIGPETIKARLPFCDLVRRHGKCGQNARYWQPKKKKDLFKMLLKENHD